MVARNNNPRTLTFACNIIKDSHMHHTSDTNQSRYQRFRFKRKAQGMKELRLWVPDPSASGFREEALRQSKRVSEQTEENEALGFIEAAARSIEDWK